MLEIVVVRRNCRQDECEYAQPAEQDCDAAMPRRLPARPGNKRNSAQQQKVQVERRTHSMAFLSHDLNCNREDGGDYIRSFTEHHLVALQSGNVKIKSC